MPQTCDMGQTVLLSLRRKACCGFFRPKNPTALAGYEPAMLGTSGQHANQWTTEAANIVSSNPLPVQFNLLAPEFGI
jgi:hypothetical protein